MKNLIFLFLLFYVPFQQLKAQSSLFDDTKVSSVYIEIPADSLNYIMTNVLSEHYFKSRFIFDYGSGRDTLENAGFRLRGNTSRYAQKKSFKISFNEYMQGRKYQGVKKINLNAQHNDPSMIREKLFYNTWKETGLVERRTTFVRMYINQQYYGLYTLLEEFDKEWVDRVYSESAGNLYKCTYPAPLDYIGNVQQIYKDIQSVSVTGGRAYDLQTNQSADDYSDLVQLIVALNQPQDESFANAVSQVLDVDEVLKAFALDVATGNWDDYMYNKNNYYLYHRQSTGKFEYIAYDCDNTFGVDWEGQDWATRNCLDWLKPGESRPLAQKLLAVPAFNNKYMHYLDSIARNILFPSLIFPPIDAMKDLIYSAAAEDHYRTLDYGYTTANFLDAFSFQIDNHTPYGIKPFLALRRSKILEQLQAFAVPELTANGLSPLNVYPNPGVLFFYSLRFEFLTVCLLECQILFQ